MPMTTHERRSTRTYWQGTPFVGKRLAASLLAVLVAVGCGGGGGGSDAPPPIGGGSAPPALSGRLWHDNFGLDSTRGLQVSALDGTRSRLIDVVETAVPTPDGSHYVSFEYDFRTGVSTLVIRTSAAATEVARATFNGYVHRVRPSPGRLGDLLVTWASSAGGVGANQGELTFVDLPGRRVLEAFSEVDAAADWLPDGRYVHVDAAGRVYTGTPGGTRSQVGEMHVAGRALEGLWADPSGQRLITRWVERDSGGGTVATDLWISTLDGGNLERLTATGLTTYGRWSPDGAYFGFDHDTDSVCTGTGCSGAPVGSCDLYVAPTGGRNLSLGSTGVSSFTVVDQEGRSETLGCDLLGWTR